MGLNNNNTRTYISCQQPHPDVCGLSLAVGRMVGELDKRKDSEKSSSVACFAIISSIKNLKSNSTKLYST